MICGADNWVEIENYGIAKQEWLNTFLELHNGIPCHDTLERTFARLRPEQVQQCLLNQGKRISKRSEIYRHKRGIAR